MTTALYPTLLALSFLGHSGLVAACFEWSFATAFLTVISGYVVVLFMGGAMGLLFETDAVLFWSGLPALLVAVWLMRRKGVRVQSILLQPPLILFCIYAAFTYFLLSGRMLTMWDEFSHWGLVAKLLSETGSLYKTNSALYCQDYPPGPALLIYHVVKATGFSDGRMIFAQSFFYFVPFLAFVRGLGWRRLGEIFLVLVVLYAALVSLSFGYGVLMVDGILSLFFGAALAIYYGEGRSARGIIATIPIFAALVIIKKTGFFLAIIGGLLLTLDQLIGRETLKARVPRIIAASGVFFFAVMMNFSWHSYVTHHHLSETFSNPVTIGMIHQSLSTEATEFQREVRRNFVHALYSWDIAPKVTLPVWLALFLVICGMAYFAQAVPEARRRFLVTATVILAGMAFYLFGLLVLYLFRFSLYEGPRLASFPRYVCLYALGALLVAIAALREACHGGFVREAVKVGALVWLATIFLSLAPPGSLTAFWQPRQSSEAVELQIAYAPGIEMVHRLTPRNARIFLVVQNTKGIPYFSLSYQLAPRRTNLNDPFSWSIRAPGQASELFQTDLTPKEWAKLLAELHDYVWVVEKDKAFESTYNVLFEGGVAACGLYRVEKGKDMVRLKPIEFWSRDDKGPTGRQ